MPCFSHQFWIIIHFLSLKWLMIVFWRCFELVIWFLVMFSTSFCSFCAWIRFTATASSWNVRRVWACRATERPWWWGIWRRRHTTPGTSTTRRLKLARDHTTMRWKFVSFRNSSRIHAACCTHFVLLPYRWQFSTDTFSFCRYYAFGSSRFVPWRIIQLAYVFFCQRHFRVNYSMMLRYIFVHFLVVLLFPENFQTFLATSRSEVFLSCSVMFFQTIK